MIEIQYLIQLKLKNFKKLKGAFYLISTFFTNLILGNFNKLFYGYFREKGVSSSKNTIPIIVSLTTFPSRIKEVSICIETIMCQTSKPDRIILWLAKSQFNDLQSLPKHLLYLQKRGLEIKFCEDLRSHKKYYYTIKENLDSVVITLDDDVFYPKYTLERLLKSYKKYPDCICCNNAKYINNYNNEIQPYNTWKPVKGKHEVKSIQLIPIGVSGVLYPPYSLSPIVFNKEDIKSLCFHTDDLWLKAMSYIQNTEILYTGEFPTLMCVGKSQATSLGNKNCGENRNDIELENILNTYPNVFLNLK